MSRNRHAGRWIVESLPLAGPFADLLAPGEQRSFDDEDRARRERDRLERRSRQRVNPFRVGQGALASLTSLEPALFRDWLLDAGLDPPPLDPPPDWAAWYDCHSARWDDGQRDRFWQALDLLRFHRVVERSRRKGYVVLEVGWMWCDEPPYYTDPECRHAVEVFSDRADAERRRRERETQRRAEWGAHVEFSWDNGHGPTADAPMYEVVEIDWEEEP